jgi:cytochrome c oxidase subunit 2
MLIAMSDSGESLWFPPQASQWAEKTDSVFLALAVAVTVVFIVAVAAMLYCVMRFRRGRGEAVQSACNDNPRLEYVFILAFGVPLMALFASGFGVYMDIRLPPADAYAIRARGENGAWTFLYPDGTRVQSAGEHATAEICVPPHVPVRISATSADALYGLYIPAFRVQTDVLPGRYSQIWFVATRPGKYPVLCSAYCGACKSEMRATCVVADNETAFRSWLRDRRETRTTTLALTERGRRIYSGKGGCASCHSVDGTRRVGPTLRALFGSHVVLQHGMAVTADAEYLRESILRPGGKLVAGYDSVMPSYEGRLTPCELDAVIEFIGSLRR